MTTNPGARLATDGQVLRGATNDEARVDHILKVSGLHVRFGGVKAVTDVSFQVGSGEILGLIGPNGAGKTTSFNAVSGMVVPTEGRIALRGHDVTGWPPERMAALGMARTFQNIQLFEGLSVRENVMVGAGRLGSCGLLASVLRVGRHNMLERLKGQAADKWIERLGLAPYAETMAQELPLGLQRVAEVARAMAAEPAILLLDEPAAGLNRGEKDALGRVLRLLAAEADCAMVVVDHDVPLVMEIANRIVVLDHGVKIMEGRPDEVRADPRVIAAYLGTTEELA